MMKAFKILSSLAFVALAATVNADGDCQAPCEEQCHAFVTDVATGLQCPVDNDHAGITNTNCEAHCKTFCQAPADGCQDMCHDECQSFATDVAKDLECQVNEDDEVMEEHQCEGHCAQFCDILQSAK